MATRTQHRKALIRRITEGDAHASAQSRRAAFDKSGSEPARALLAKVATHAYKVTDEDIAAVKQAGLTEDEIFELVVCAAVGQSHRQLESALAALDEATREPDEATSDVARAAVAAGTEG